MANKENKNVIKREGDKSKILCHEDYAQELYDLMYGTDVICKDVKSGEILRVIDFRVVSEEDKEIEAVCENLTSLFFNFAKERKYFEMIGLNEDSFFEWVNGSDTKEFLKNQKTYIQIENVNAGKGSLYQAHLKTIITEFKQQIVKPTSAYTAKVIDKNDGGFIAEVQGIKCFLPGSLAAANKIVDFDSYIGKEIFVMIEDYLKNSNIFVVSYKKYLANILPSKLGELERNQLMKGVVTGSSKFGVFIEIDDMFTGLLHTAEMTSETLEKFNKGYFKSGLDIEVWLKDIRDNKLILTETDPAIRQNEFETFKEKVEGNMKEGVIISIKAHGALMEIEKGVLGLLPVKEMKKASKRLVVGEQLEVFIKKVDVASGKIYLTMSDEHVTTEA